MKELSIEEKTKAKAYDEAICHKKVLFADLDGTLIDTISGNTFPKGIWDMQFNWDVLTAIKNYGFEILIIVSNQGGIEKGFVDERHFCKGKMNYIQFALMEYLGIPVEYDYCKFNDKDNYFRKPNVGMLEHVCFKNLPKHNIFASKDEMLMIGDASGKEGQFSDSDKKTAENFGIDYFDVEDFKQYIELISVIKVMKDYTDWSNVYNYVKKKLEKQDGKNKVKSEIVKDYIGEENVWNDARDFRPKHLQRCLCYDKYMGGEYCYVYDDISKYWCTQTTEEHDPDGENHISDYSDFRVTAWRELSTTPFYPSKDSIEKQGKSALEAIKEEKVDNANKAKPKFKVRDWLQYRDAEPFLVEEITEQGYCNGNSCLPFEWEDEIRPWTIQDAKDGDLIYVSTEVKGIQAIFHKFENGIIYFHCNLCGDFTQGGYEPSGDVEFVNPLPKTHYQRFFQKMKEACYEWDAKNKTLWKTR